MRLRTTLAVIGLAAALTACAAVRPTRFYTLEPATVPKATAPTPAARAKGPPPVGLGPVETPAYLDRPAERLHRRRSRWQTSQGRIATAGRFRYPRPHMT